MNAELSWHISALNILNNDPASKGIPPPEAGRSIQLSLCMALAYEPIGTFGSVGQRWTNVEAGLLILENAATLPYQTSPLAICAWQIRLLLGALIDSFKPGPTLARCSESPNWIHAW